MEEKHQILRELEDINNLLPPGRDIEPKLIKLIREIMIDYFGEPDNKSVFGEEISDFFITKEISQEDFSKFPLSVDNRTINKFMEDSNFSRSENSSKGGINTKNKSIRSIAAFLVANKKIAFSVEDVLHEKLGNNVAREVAAFAKNNYDEESKSLEEFIGKFYSEKEIDNEVIYRKLEFIKSDDGSHFLVEERREIKNKFTKKKGPIKAYLGWAIKTQDDTLIVFLKDENLGKIHNYISLHIETDESKKFETKNILLFRIAGDFKKSSSSIELMNSKEITEDINKNILLFKRFGTMLTDNKLLDAKKIKRLSRQFGADSRSSYAKNVIKMERNFVIMDADKKQKLNRELFNSIADVENLNLSRFFELLDMGASINYQDKITGATVMHLVAMWPDTDIYNEVITKSKEEYNYLIRDKQNRLASSWAFNNYPDSKELYKVIREREVEAGEKAGVNPQILRSTPL